MHKEKTSDIQEIMTKIVKFTKDRDWDQFHNGKDLALALSIEASELNEAFLWKNSEDVKVEKIKEELAKKDFTLIDDSNYSTLNSSIIIQCERGHKIEVSMNDFRRPSFTCPCCDKSINFINPKSVPPKTGYRVIAFDQATEHFGLSI